MNRRVRRIFRTGGSLAIVLPPDWLEGNELEAMSPVEILYDGTEVRIRPFHEKDEGRQ